MHLFWLKLVVRASAYRWQYFRLQTRRYKQNPGNILIFGPFYYFTFFAQFHVTAFWRIERIPGLHRKGVISVLNSFFFLQFLPPLSFIHHSSSLSLARAASVCSSIPLSLVGFSVSSRICRLSHPQFQCYLLVPSRILKAPTEILFRKEKCLKVEVFSYRNSFGSTLLPYFVGIKSWVKFRLPFHSHSDSCFLDNYHQFSEVLSRNIFFCKSL